MLADLIQVQQAFEGFNPSIHTIKSAKGGVLKEKLGLLDRFRVENQGSQRVKAFDHITKAAAMQIVQIAAEGKETLKEIKELAGFKALREQIDAQCISGKFSSETRKIGLLFQQIFGSHKANFIPKEGLAVVDLDAAPQFSKSDREDPDLVSKISQLHHAFSVAGAVYQVDELVLQLMQSNSRAIYLNEFFPEEEPVLSLQERVFAFVEELMKQRAEMKKMKSIDEYEAAKSAVKNGAIQVTHEIFDIARQLKRSKLVPCLSKSEKITQDLNIECIKMQSAIVDPVKRGLSHTIIFQAIEGLAARQSVKTKEETKQVSAKREKRELEKRAKDLQKLKVVRERERTPLAKMAKAEGENTLDLIKIEVEEQKEGSISEKIQLELPRITQRMRKLKSADLRIQTLSRLAENVLKRIEEGKTAVSA